MQPSKAIVRALLKLYTIASSRRSDATPWASIFFSRNLKGDPWNLFYYLHAEFEHPKKDEMWLFQRKVYSEQEL